MYCCVFTVNVHRCVLSQARNWVYYYHREVNDNRTFRLWRPSSAVRQKCYEVSCLQVQRLVLRWQVLMGWVVNDRKVQWVSQAVNGRVHQVPCKDCSKVYIGQTKRTLKIRMAEHKQVVKKGDEKNGIAVHAHTTNHSVDWEGAWVQGTAWCFWKRTVEAIQICTEPHTMNLDCGLHPHLHGTPSSKVAQTTTPTHLISMHVL